MKTEDIQARARRWLEDFDGIVGHPGITAVLIRDLLAEVENAQASRWRSMDEAPQDWRHVLVATGSGDVAEAYWHCDAGEWMYANLGPDDPDSVVVPMHWQPLPEPPR